MLEVCALTYMLWYRPFKHTVVDVLAIINQVFSLVIIIFFIPFLWTFNIAVNKLSIIGWVVTGLVIIMIFVNVIYLLVDFIYFAVQKCWSKCKKKKPDEETQNETENENLETDPNADAEENGDVTPGGNYKRKTTGLDRVLRWPGDQLEQIKKSDRNIWID